MNSTLSKITSESNFKELEVACQTLFAEIQLACETGSAARLRHKALSSASVQKLLSRTTSRAGGIFFTPDSLARKVAKGLPKNGSTVFDPSCGAGDLLIAAAGRMIDSSKPASENLSQLSCRIAGIDVIPELVQLSRMRLLSYVLTKSSRIDVNYTQAEQAFDRIRTGDALILPWDEATDILMNPPFNRTNFERQGAWLKGNRTIAADHVQVMIENSRNARRFVAVLPDVLRSGSRYRIWRESVSTSVDVLSYESAGLFSSYADIDVALLRGHWSKRLRSAIPVEGATTSQQTLGDVVQLSVGAVVPHRHPEAGTPLPYVNVGSALPWQVVTPVSSRGFLGRRFTPPFVVVRRTSSPRDRARGIATIVLGSTPTAVENHLVVLEPNEGSIEACEAILQNLRDARTTSWLNQRIRCRHLTIAALAELPLWNTEGEAGE